MTTTATAPTRRRVTPTGVLVANLDPIEDRAAWLAERRKGIGGSDVPALLGLSQYRSELDLYLDKIGKSTDEESGEAALWGTLLEDPVAREWARREGVTVRRVGTIAHVERDWQRTNVDRAVVGCPQHGRCFLEVKTRSAYVSDQWTDVLPDDVEAQVQWSLAVTGLPAAHVAALIGGQRLVSYTIEPDPVLMDQLTAIGARFWRDHVTARVEPLISSIDLLVDYLSAMDVDPAEIRDLSEDEAAKVLALLDERRDLKAEAKRLDAIDAELKTWAGDKAVVRIDGENAFTYKATKRRTFDQAAFAEDHPGLIDDYMRTTTSRRLNVAKRHT